jgi:DNA-binding NarL/FixJ family response regulator
MLPLQQPMDAPRHVLVVESTRSCTEELRRHHFHVVAFADAEAAFYAAPSVEAVVIHLDSSDDAEPRTALVRRLQSDVATRYLPIVIAITGRPNRPDTVPVQRFGGALIVLTNAQCEGVAAVLEELLHLERS